MAKRDEFSEGTKRTIAFRAGCRCSFEGCDESFTFGPHTDENKHVNLGQACHITAARPGGPRYNSDLTPEARKSAANGIWMCLRHAKLIDADPDEYPVELLNRWKKQAENRARDLGTRGHYHCQAPALDREEFVAREALDRMAGSLVQGAEHQGIYALTTALQGAGGFGKTTLAQALAWDPRVQDAYPDGVFWTVLGESPSEAERIQAIRGRLIPWTGRDVPMFETAVDAGLFLRKELAGKRALVVVDDVWRRKDLIPFEGLGPGSALLVTTRIRDALPTRAQTIDVDAMEAEESIELLSRGFDGRFEAEDFERLSERLGHWPLLIKLVNAQLRKLTARGLDLSRAISKIERGFAKRGLTAFDRADEQARERAVEATMNAAFDAGLLSKEDERRYRSLAVFPEDTDIPIEMLAPIWDLDEEQAEEACGRLRDVSLVLDLNLGHGTIRLHDVFRKYLIDSAEDLAALQAGFLAAHRPASGRWAELPRDPKYLWQHLAYHLKAADCHDTLDELLLDPAYLSAKLRTTEINSLLSDFEGRDPARLLIADALRKSAHCLSDDPNQLPAQLIGRLGEAEEPILSTLVEKLRTEPGLVLLRGSLTPAGGPLRQTLKGHTSGVEAVVELEGGRIVSASNDSTLRVWDGSTGRHLHTLGGHKSQILAVTVIEGGRVVSASNDCTLRIWDLESDSCLHALKGHEGAVVAVAKLEEGRLVSASRDSTLRVWDAGSGDCLHTLRGHTNQVSAVAVTGGERIVSASHDLTLRIWDGSSGCLLRTLQGHTKSITAVAALEDGRIVSASHDSTLRIWDGSSGSCLHTLKGHTAVIVAMAVDLKARRIVSASYDSNVRVWDLETGRCLHILRGHSRAVVAVALLEGGRFASASNDATLQVWDLDSGRCLHKLKGHAQSITAVTGLDGERIVSASLDSTLRIWSLGASRRLPSLKGHGVQVKALAELGEGRVVSASFDSALRVWDLETGRCLLTLRGHVNEVEAVTMLDEQRVVSASSDDTLRVWSLDFGRCLRTLRGHTQSVLAVTVHPFEGGHMVVSASMDSTLRVWDVENGRCLRTLVGHQDGIFAIAALEGGLVVSASSDKTLRIWDVENGRCLHTLQGHTDWVVDVAAVEQGRFVSASRDGTLRVWDGASGRCLHTLQGHAKSVRTVQAVEGGRQVVSRSFDSTLRVWDVESGQCVQTIPAHASQSKALVAFSAERVIFASDDSSLRLWDAASNTSQVLFTADGPIRSLLAVGPSGPFVVGESSGRLHILRWNEAG